MNLDGEIAEQRHILFNSRVPVLLSRSAHVFQDGGSQGVPSIGKQRKKLGSFISLGTGGQALSCLLGSPPLELWDLPLHATPGLDLAFKLVHAFRAKCSRTELMPPEGPSQGPLMFLIMTKVRDCSKDLVAPHTEKGRHSPDPRRTPCALWLLAGLSCCECFSNSSVSVTHTLATPDSSLSWIGLQPPGFYFLFFPSGIPSVKVLPPKPNLTFSRHLKCHHIPQESPPSPIAPRIPSPLCPPSTLLQIPQHHQGFALRSFPTQSVV